MECSCCFDSGGVTNISVTVCCFQVVCQQCANDLTAKQVCFCGQQYQGSQLFQIGDVSPAQHPSLQQRLDQERVKMEDWFKQASGAHVVWHLDVPLLNYYQAELKALALTQERLDRFKSFPSGYYVKDLPDYRFKPPGYIMYHHEYTGARPSDHHIMPETASVQPHSFEDIFQFCLDSLTRALGPDEIKHGRGKHEFHQTALVRFLCEYENFNLTESLVDKYPQLNWQYQFLVEHPNFTLDFLKSRHEQGLAGTRGTSADGWIYCYYNWYESFFTTGKAEQRQYSNMIIKLPKLAKMPPLDDRDYHGSLFCLLNNANFKWVLDYDYYGP